MLQTTPVAKKLPSLVEIKHLVAMLFDPETVCRLRKAPLTNDQWTIVAVHLDSERAIQRIPACDLAFANSCESALTAMPATAANKAIQSGRLADPIFDNVCEVMNVAVNLIAESFSARLELASASRQVEFTPEILTVLPLSQRVKIDFTIPKHDRRRLDFLAV